MSAEPVPHESETLCATRALSVVYPESGRETRALDGVDFELRRGERTAIVGDSGSGKSTLLLALVRLLPRDARIEGSIRFDGRDVTALTNDAARALRGASIGIVFQDSKSALHPLLCVEEQVAEAWTAHGRASRSHAFELARAALARVGLDPERYGRAFPHELSGGMRQRVQIATALALQPALLVLDEPTTALDTVTQKMIFDLIDDLRAESGFATLLVTHDLRLACERADRIVRLSNGRVIDDRPARDVARGRGGEARRVTAVTESDLTARAPGANGREAVLETRDLAVAYAVRGPFLSRKLGPPVVHDVSLAIAPGEALALVGNSGSGKTTFVRALLRLVEPVSGAILYRARAGATAVDLRALAGQSLRAVRPDLGVVFQDPATSLDPRQRARDVLLEALSARGRTDGNDAAIARLLDDVGLTSAHLARFPHQLSGGEAQRLCLLRALATEPRVLVLDEALSSLDPQLRTRILDLLTRLRRDSGLACLLVTHDLGSVESFADRVAVMANGRIVETGPTATIFRAPQSSETRALLAARPGSVDLHAEIAPQDRA